MSNDENETVLREHQALAKNIADLKKRLQKIRPLTGVALEKLNQSYDIELTYTSNALEGNTLTLRETGLIIEKGMTVAGKPLVSHLEALDHYEAVQMMRELASEARTIGETDVLDLHRLVTRRSSPTIAGTYAKDPRRIGGSRVVLPGPHKISGLMKTFGTRLETATGWSDAFEAHYGLVTIHPFADGNGRTARLLMNVLLVRDGFPPLPIGPDVRLRYLNVLEDRQLAEPLGHNIVDQKSGHAYRQFMGRALMNATEAYLKIVEPEVEEKPVAKPTKRTNFEIGD